MTDKIITPKPLPTHYVATADFPAHTSSGHKEVRVLEGTILKLSHKRKLIVPAHQVKAPGKGKFKEIPEMVLDVYPVDVLKWVKPMTLPAVASVEVSAQA